MLKITHLLVSLMFLLGLLASFTIVKPYSLLENSSFSVYTKSEVDFRFFKRSDFDNDKNSINFITRKATSQIRIYDQFGIQEFLLPVNSDKVFLNRSLFTAGSYTIVFDVDTDRSLFRSYLEFR